MLYGAILGDIVGSPYEFGNGYKSKDFPLFVGESHFTDDSVMTMAVARALTLAGRGAGREAVCRLATEQMSAWGNRYPDAGYGGRFIKWLKAPEDQKRPYGSYGNGSAMRVSPVSWYYDSLQEVLDGARWTAQVTHDHPEGIKGAQAEAAAVFLARKGEGKEGLIVTSNYFVAENGVTRRSRRFSAFIGCLCDNRLGNNGNIHIVHKVEKNLHFLLALAAGLVRGIDNDLLDILVHDGLCQFLHIHIFLCQGDKGIQTVIHFFPLFHPFFDNFNFEL